MSVVAEAELLLRVHNSIGPWGPQRVRDIEAALYLCRKSQQIMGPVVAAEVLDCQTDVLVRLHGPRWHESVEARALGIGSA